MISLGEILSDIPFLTMKMFIYGTEKYIVLVLGRLWTYLNGIVVIMYRILSFEQNMSQIRFVMAFAMGYLRG